MTATSPIAAAPADPLAAPAPETLPPAPADWLQLLPPIKASHQRWLDEQFRIISGVAKDAVLRTASHLAVGDQQSALNALTGVVKAQKLTVWEAAAVRSLSMICSERLAVLADREQVRPQEGADAESTPGQLTADADHLAARRALDDFTRLHESYFLAAGRRHPDTGELYVQPNRALDRERQRLFEIYVATNVEGHKADAAAARSFVQRMGARTVGLVAAPVEEHDHAAGSSLPRPPGGTDRSAAAASGLSQAQSAANAYAMWRLAVDSGEQTSSGNEIFHGDAVEAILGDTRHESRYGYDGALLERGWIQYPTSKDAHDFGIWMHVDARLVMTYTAGERSLIKCDMAADFDREVAALARVFGPPLQPLAIEDFGGAESHRRERQQ